MVATGAAVLELDYKCDLLKIKEATQGKATIWGYRSSEVLAYGTPELVTRRLRRSWRSWRQWWVDPGQAAPYPPRLLLIISMP